MYALTVIRATDSSRRADDGYPELFAALLPFL
jgi:hypothetical protein